MLTSHADAAATLASLIDRLPGRVAKNPSRAAEYANEIQEQRGVVEVMAGWEALCAYLHNAGRTGVAAYVDQAGWLMDAATQRVDDEWSGRGNDGRRAFHDGRLRTLQQLRQQVQRNGESLVTPPAVPAVEDGLDLEVDVTARIRVRLPADTSDMEVGIAARKLIVNSGRPEDAVYLRFITDTKIVGQTELPVSSAK